MNLTRTAKEHFASWGTLSILTDKEPICSHEDAARERLGGVAAALRGYGREREPDALRQVELAVAVGILGPEMRDNPRY